MSSAVPEPDVSDHFGRSTGGSTLTPTYKVMYGSDQQTEMADANNDGVYEGTIPAGAGAGELIRCKIAASRPGRTGSYPREGPSPGRARAP